VNKKKSGVLIVDRPTGLKTEINEYPIRKTYRYLGIKIDNYMSPIAGVNEVHTKLNVYLKRNSWLIKTHFTPKSLVTLSNYYHQSRIIYGMNCFLDHGNIIDKIEKHGVQYVKSILGLNNSCNSDRVRAALYKPRIEHSLWLMLRKNIKKYIKHFKSTPNIYDKINLEYENWFKQGKPSLVYKQADLENIDDRELKRLTAHLSVTQQASGIGVEVSANFKRKFDKHYYKYPDKRDGLLLRYLVNYGFFNGRLFEKCQYCDGKNSRSHVTNDCPHFEELRMKTLRELRSVGTSGSTLERLVLQSYFSPTQADTGKTGTPKVLEVLKKFVAQLYIGRDKRSS
jgi:hypothetical protein